MRLPSTFCATLNSISTEPFKILCKRFHSAKNKMCQLTSVEISLARLSKKVLSLGIAHFSKKVENH